MSTSTSRRLAGPALAAVLLSALAVPSGSALADFFHHGISQSGEQKNNAPGRPRRPARAPVVPAQRHRVPGGRTIAFAGTHGGSKPNPLNGGVVEQNGVVTSTPPIQRKPVENSIFRAGRGRSIAIGAHCVWGPDLPKGISGHVYLLRNVQGSSASGYEVWDVPM